MTKSNKVLSFAGNINHPRPQKTTMRRQCQQNTVCGLDKIFYFTKLKMLKAFISSTLKRKKEMQRKNLDYRLTSIFSMS